MKLLTILFAAFAFNASAANCDYLTYCQPQPEPQPGGFKGR